MASECGLIADLESNQYRVWAWSETSIGSLKKIRLCLLFDFSEMDALIKT